MDGLGRDLQEIYESGNTELEGKSIKRGLFSIECKKRKKNYYENKYYIKTQATSYII